MKQILFSFLLLLLFSCSDDPNKEKRVNIINVDTDFIIRDDYYGGAVQWEPNDVDSLSEKQWDRLLSRIDFMHLGYIRCIMRPYTYCLGFKDDVPQYIWDENASPVSGDSSALRGRVMGLPHNRVFPDAEWKRLATRQWNDLLRILKFCQERNIRVMFGDWWFPTDENFYYMSTDDPKYARIIADCVKYLVEDKGFTCIQQYNMGNEVNINPPGYTWEKWSTGIKNLYKKFEELGLREKVALVGPDGGYWQGLWFNETLNELEDEVSVLDYHWYIDKDWLLTNRVEDEMRMMRFFTSLTRPDIPVVFGEVGVRDGHNTHTDQHMGISKFVYGIGMADIAVQAMRAGWSAVTAWDMDDAMHYHDTGDTKVWGFWNSVGMKQGRPQDEEIRPWYYTWSLLSRSFPKGSEILYCNSFRENGINGVAVKTPDGDLSFAVVNNREFAQKVTLKIPNVTNCPDINKYVYFEEDRPVDENGMPVVKEIIKKADLNRGITIDFPDRGVVILTTQGGSKPEITVNTDSIYDPLEGLQRIYSHSGNLGMNGFSKHYNECYSEGPDFHFSRFLHDYSTIHPSENLIPAYVEYKMDGIKDFKVGVSGREGIDGRFRIYASSDNKSWEEIEVVYPVPELGIWDWYHTTLSPKQKLEGYNYLKIEMDPKGWFDSSRLRDVILKR